MIILGKDGDKVKIVVVSDSHGRDDLLYDLQLQHGDADAFIHCGDVENDSESFPGYVIVQGNNDYYYDFPAERILPFGEHRILLIHSHQFPYRKREERMRAYAKERGCDIVCYGHTHVADLHRADGITLLNPGSLKYSRDGRPPSYAILTLDGPRVDAKHIFLEPPKSKSRFFW